MRYNKPERDIIETLQRRITVLERTVRHLENSHNVTIHSYSKVALPTPLVEGKIFLATDNTLCWISNGVARSVSGSAI